LNPPFSYFERCNNIFDLRSDKALDVEIFFDRVLVLSDQNPSYVNRSGMVPPDTRVDKEAIPGSPIACGSSA
jgi:hypothetical protein